MPIQPDGETDERDHDSCGDGRNSTLQNSEIDFVAGGVMSSPIDVSKMPDRMVGGCGTMWYLRELGRIFTGYPR